MDAGAGGGIGGFIAVAVKGEGRFLRGARGDALPGGNNSNYHFFRLFASDPLVEPGPESS